MNFFEIFFLNLGLSWTAAKIVPYILAVCFGFVLFIIFSKFAKSFRGKKIISIALIFAPVSLYFALYPIYEGDFSNYSKTVKTSKIFGDTQKLTVIAIPNCPYCFESIQKLKLIRQRIPSAKIEFLVCTENENDLFLYKNEAHNQFDVEIYPESAELAELIGNKFPSFITAGQNNELKIWSNSEFGVTAIDEVEELLGK